MVGATYCWCYIVVAANGCVNQFLGLPVDSRYNQFWTMVGLGYQWLGLLTVDATSSWGYQWLGKWLGWGYVCLHGARNSRATNWLMLTVVGATNG
jgi:hypothetical protein